jgi:hypothetical protein
LEWFSSLDSLDFSLYDKRRFQKTQLKWIKQSIFKEFTTNYYWYFDFFHKDNKRHYEVFDSLGDHIGEANEQGFIQQGTSDIRKSIRHLIN